ncbi:uncharacterized protein LOC115189398 isoform X12 [Salmo trutta]|uniref:uncharacterized protein LOC115189398 isoform X12 n=1 Tax=Salmo trutta TaxID=8032 RepID=UPI00113017D7|nr:uncharacterized protein LOC115189398 isoform X12 [Salmo trutta]
MASTRQSALEYITNGRRRLIGRLQNLPLIVENLFQRKVLHEEEVSKIQAEVDRFDQTRKILDWVSAKGEAACYELLMILDITRKRTLDDADLQQWISCFPLEEDPEMTDYLVGSKPCHRYQTQLKCKAQKITEGAWKQSCCLLPERCRNEGTFSYTPLVLDTDVHSSDSKIKMKSKRCKKARPKKLKSFIPIAKQETSPADLLKTHEKKILLIGKPGIGKTTVAHQMLNLWAEKDHKELDYMFYFEVRDILHRKPMSLEDLLFNMYSEPKESKEEVLQDIKNNSENVVIIFDGVTDLSYLSVVKDLVEKLLPDAKIVTTCRPDQSEDFLTYWPVDWFRVEVKGFSDESIRAYLTQMLSAEPDSLSSVLNNLELFSLCHVPMYALMVVTCIYFPTSEASKQTCTITGMYCNILRHCIQKHSAKRLKDTDKCLKENREKILSLAEIAFDATNEKNMNLTTLSCEESSVHFAFLGALMVKISPTAFDTYSAFLHYTMQDFFGALWLLQNPDKIREVLEKCQTEQWKHTKHMIPFLCGLLNERNIRLVKSLVPAQQIKKTSDWFFKEVVNTFLPSQTNQDHAEGGAPESEIDLLFLCQCLYEYQSTEACLLLLDKLDYHLDLSGEHLDPHQCCAVSYVTSQSAERKVGLDLNGCTVSDQGVRLILGSLKNVRRLGPSSDDSSDPSMLCQLWTTLLSSEAEMDFTTLLGLCGNELHLPVQGEIRVFERAEEVMKQSLERVHLCLHWNQRTVLSEALSKTILKCLPNINKLRFTPLQDQRGSSEKLETEEKAVLLDLCLQAALDQRETLQRTVNTLLSLFSVYQTERYDILLDLYSHVKDNSNQTARRVLPSLKPLYQPAPAVWSIDLSERKASLLLEVLKLQPEKKPVELKGWSDEESEVRSFLQCLSYISQLSFCPWRPDPSKQIKFLVDLVSQAAEWEEQTGEKTLKLVSSVCTYSTFPYHYGNTSKQSDFLLDLYSHVKDYETQTGRSVLPALQPVYQSAPAVWYIDLSERKASLLLEVQKLQPEKKPVELKGWSDEESEVRSFLQCLSYISQLSFYPRRSDPSKQIKFLVDLLSQAAEWEEQTGEKTLKLVSSVWTYNTFPFPNGDNSEQSDFLLDLYSHVKDYETQTGRSVLPALQPVYQSAPAVWSINLSERKASLLLEVLKLQPEKKPVELKGWSDEESEVRSFLQYLPYISQLSFCPWRSDPSKQIKFLVDLLSQAAEWEEQTGEKTLKLVSSVWTYSTFPFPNRNNSERSDFLLDLYSHVKDYETQTGRSVLPALQPVYQSAPAVLFIYLSERKASLLLEVLKLQPEKKPVELKGWSDVESEVRSFLQCLPYISQLRFLPLMDNIERRKREKTFLLNLCLQAALHERGTIQTTVEKVLSLSEVYHYQKWDFLLDLYSHVKVYETKTGRSVLPALQPVYQSASPAVWSIDLSERKASLLLEMLKLQPEKKPVELKGCSDEESEVRSFLQCLPYISQLSFYPWWSDPSSQIKFLVDLLSQAAEWEEQTGEKTLKLVSSVCTYRTFPFCVQDDDESKEYQCDFLLDLYSHVKDYETQTGRSVLPALQPVYQLASLAVWSIDLSERKASLLLEVLKLQPEKKPVELKDWSDEDIEVRSFFQCLPYISQLSFYPDWSDHSKQIKFLVELLSQAAEWEEQTGEKTLKLVSSVWTYSTFPFPYRDNSEQSDFLLDLYSHVKDYETQTGRSVLPALQPVYQSAPAVWSIDLSERKASLLLEVLKLQPEKKPVNLKGWSDEESVVRSFLQCLSYISQLRFYPRRSDPSKQIKFLVDLLSQAAEREEQTGEKTLKLVSSVWTYNTFPFPNGDNSKQSDFLLDLYSHVKDYKTQTGRSVLPALQPVYQSASPAVWSIDLRKRKASLLLEVLKLQPEKKPVKLKGWSDEEIEVRSFVQCLSYISQLRLNVGMAVKLSRLVRRTERGATPLTVLELSLVLKSSQPPERVLSRALSSVASLLRLWRVQCLDLTDFWIQGHSLITLLCHQGPLSLRLNSDTLQQLTVVVYEAQDKDLTQWFLEKVGGDLTSCRLDWEVLLSLLQHSTHNITVDLRKNRLLENNISDLLPFLGRVTLKRSSSSFVKSSIRQIYDSRDSDCVSSLLRSSDHWINLNSRELDRVDCTALCFTLQHSHQVKVNLLWTSIPPGEIESILPLLDRVSQLSIDRRLLLSFLQCCAASQVQQGAPPPPPTAVWLLRSLHYRLDFSCSSSVDLSAQDQEKALCLTTDHCRDINSVLKQNQHSTQLVQNQVQLILRDCEVEDRALRELLPILHIVKLSPSKALLLQLLDLVCEGIEEGLLRHTESLCRALDGELDLSETRLDQKACGSLALVLEHSEGLSELDLSHCQLTDHHLQPLITHLHKVQVLDLSHNDITDALTDRILQLVSTNTSMHTVRLFNNRIMNRTPFLTDKRFEI